MTSMVTEWFGLPASESTGLWSGADSHALQFRSWAQVRADARRVAAGLAAAGVGPGASVAILAGEPVDVAVLVQAIWMRGAAFTMLHQPTPRSDLATWVADTHDVIAMLRSAAVVVAEPFADAVVGVRLGAPVVRLDALLATAREAEHLDSSNDDVAILQLTSGTTGAPKAVAISHRNIAQNHRAMFEAIEFDPASDVAVSWLPLYHDMGMVGLLLMPMIEGIATALITPLGFLRDPLSWAQLITQFGGTCTAAPNFAYAVLAKRLRRAPDGAYDLSTLRVAINGAEAVDEDTLNLFVREGARFGLRPEAVMPCYGMAETTLAASFTPLDVAHSVDIIDALPAEETGEIHRVTPVDPGDTATNRPTRTLMRLGPPVPGMQIRVVDDDATELPVDRIGNVLVRGDAVTERYLGADGYTNALDADGWLATGDLGYLTPDGEVVISGRKKDVIIVSGRNLSPVVIERAAVSVTGVRPGNVAAVAHRSNGGREGIAVIAESDATDDTECDRIRKEVSRAVFEDVGVAVSVVTIVGRGALPKTPSGKIRRRHAAGLIEA